MLRDLAGVGVSETQRGVDPDASEQGVGVAAGGAGEGDDLVERGAPRAGVEERMSAAWRESGETARLAVALRPSRLDMWWSTYAHGEGG